MRFSNPLMASGPAAVGWAGLAMIAVVFAAAAVVLGLTVQEWVQQDQDGAAWREWERFKVAPSTRHAVGAAEALRRQVEQAVLPAAPTAGADTILVGSYRNLSFQAPHSDVDIKVILGACRDFGAVRDALTAPGMGFTHMYTASSYALFRRVDGPDGLHADVSVTARDRGEDLRDDVHCAGEVARELDLRGFLMRMARRAVATSAHAGAPYVTVRHRHSVQ